jgi:hypothetical protein
MPQNIVIYSTSATISNGKSNVAHDVLLLVYRGKTAKNYDELYLLGKPVILLRFEPDISTICLF